MQRGVRPNRQPSSSVARHNEDPLERIRALKAAHPFWGYQCIWAYLHFVEQEFVHGKRILRLTREHYSRLCLTDS